MITKVRQLLCQQLDNANKNIRLPIEGDRLRKWNEFVSKRVITQQAALLAMIDWIVQQDEMTQAMILGQIPATPDLVQLVLRQMAAEQSAKKHGDSKGHGVKLLKAASKQKDLQD